MKCDKLGLVQFHKEVSRVCTTAKSSCIISRTTMCTCNTGRAFSPRWALTDIALTIVLFEALAIQTWIGQTWIENYSKYENVDNTVKVRTSNTLLLLDVSKTGFYNAIVENHF